MHECDIANSGVLAPSGVSLERKGARGCVEETFGVEEKSECSICGILLTRTVAQKRPAPVAVLLSAMLLRRVPAPMAVLKLLSVLLKSEKIPTAVLNVPVVRLESAEAPSAVLPPG